MLPSIYQLPTIDVIHTLRYGQRIQHDMLQLRYIKTTKSQSRLSIIVSKKCDKKAVKRNRIKRQLAMAFLPYLAKDTITKDIVCKIAQNGAHMSFKDIKQNIETFFTNVS